MRFPVAKRDGVQSDFDHHLLPLIPDGFLGKLHVPRFQFIARAPKLIYSSNLFTLKQC